MSDTQSQTMAAIKAAQTGNWKEAYTLNTQICEQEPENIGALNRLAFCCMQLGETSKAKKLYENVLSLEHHNSIARKYLELIKQKLDFVPQKSVTNIEFIEEPGKTKSVGLVRLADPDILMRTAIATPCVFILKNHRLDIRTQDGNVYLGSLPDDIAFRISRLLKLGNTYTLLVQSTSKKSIQIFIKELARAKEVLDTPSFPVTMQQSPSLQEDVLLDEAPLDTRETGSSEESESEIEESNQDETME